MNKKTKINLAFIGIGVFLSTLSGFYLYLVPPLSLYYLSAINLATSICLTLLLYFAFTVISPEIVVDSLGFETQDNKGRSLHKGQASSSLSLLIAMVISCIYSLLSGFAYTYFFPFHPTIPFANVILWIVMVLLLLVILFMMILVIFQSIFFEKVIKFVWNKNVIA